MRRVWGWTAGLGILVALSSCGGSSSTDRLASKLRSCELLTEGDVGEGLLADGDENEALFKCGVDCVDKAPCEEVTLLFCSLDLDPNSSLGKCFGACEAKEPSFTCTDGMEMPDAYRCDGEDDCDDGSDEEGCPSFMCADGETIHQDYKCDGDDDCDDGSDEEGCPSFKCADGETVPQGYECDGEEDCTDGSDETGCAMLQCGT